MRSAVATALLLALALAAAAQQAKRKPQRLRCDRSDACFPWTTDGPFCRRGDNINIRFQVQLAPENYHRETAANVFTPEAFSGPITNMTYAFCPRADELSAFNITRLGVNSLTWPNGTAYDPILNVTYQEIALTEQHQIFLSVIGFGDQRNINFPQPNSSGRVLIADYDACEYVGEFGIVDFLVFNISMDRGRLKYYEEHLDPAGTGFVPTCTTDGVCQLDPSLRCFGPRGRQNCGRCLSNTTELEDWRLTTWVSYYGTDVRGRQLLSGASNPLNFQVFSGSGVGVAMTRSFTRIENGQTVDDDDLSPDGEIRRVEFHEAEARFDDY